MRVEVNALQECKHCGGSGTCRKWRCDRQRGLIVYGCTMCGEASVPLPEGFWANMVTAVEGLQRYPTCRACNGQGEVRI